MASTHHGVVYTKKWVVDLILDVAGYVPGTGISDKVIIEPSCGCGAFLTVIAGRLADDAIAVGKGWTSLGNAIRAYDIDSASIETARKAAVEALMTRGCPAIQARELCEQWITSGKHLDPIAAIIRDDLINAGFHPDEVYDQGRMCTLPGWFRPTKNWDLLALDNGELVSAIELKSINSSFGNNANNRAEESIGSAFDAHTAFDEHLLGSSSIPPVMGYVMIVHDCPDSRIVGRGVRSAHFPIDPDFEGASYLDRFLLLCDRLRRKSLYQAVWLVFANPEDGVAYEPSALLSYDKFIANIVMALGVHRA